jgi:hypothetical protein
LFLVVQNDLTLRKIQSFTGDAEGTGETTEANHVCDLDGSGNLGCWAGSCRDCAGEHSATGAAKGERAAGGSSTLCFGFAGELAGASGLGRFLSGFIAGFWLLRIVLQVFYYDKELRRENRGLDTLYVGSLIGLVLVFGVAAIRPS